MKFSPEFKVAISELSNKEKDQLILRLLKKDKILAERIYFELLDPNTVEDRRLIIEQKLIDAIKTQSQRFYTTGYLLQNTRWASGVITEHVKITKDKYGEPYLNLILLINSLKCNKSNLNGGTYNKSYSFNIYVVARIFKIMTQIQALHEDLRIEFKDLLNELASLFEQFPYLMKVAINNHLDLNWMLSGEIPEDIVARQKELRAKGFLK